MVDEKNLETEKKQTEKETEIERNRQRKKETMRVAGVYLS